MAEAGARTLRQTSLVAGLSVLLVALVALMDYMTGPAISFSIFFLIPVSVSAWLAGRRTALFLAVASGIAWLAVDMIQVRQPQIWIHFWNASVRMVFFTVTAILLSAWKAASEQIKDLLSRRTAALATAVTEQKKTEEELALSEKKFYQAQKMETIGRLAGGIAHDFRNQLTVIMGYGDILQAHSCVNEEGKEYLDEILRAAERSARMTGQLLVFSRKEILRPQVVNLNRTLDELQRPLAKMIGEDIELQFLPEANLGNSLVDVMLFQQALMNLAINARDAMPDGGRLTIETNNLAVDDDYADRHEGLKPGRYVMVAVSDTGVGMSPEVREHVFEPFYTTKPSGQGTGLGLSMVYGFVRESGGHISVYSEEGHGSVFRLYFPRVDMPVTVEEMAEQAPAPRGTETVLVVDDDRSVRQLTCDFLRDLGYRVLEAGGSREALSLADSYEVALLLTDVVMPGISGTTLARQLQARYPSIRVLYMTGYTENGIGHYGIVDKDIPLITKPFNKHRLSRAVRGALSGR